MLSLSLPAPEHVHSCASANMHGFAYTLKVKDQVVFDIGSEWRVCPAKVFPVISQVLPNTVSILHCEHLTTRQAHLGMPVGPPFPLLLQPRQLPSPQTQQQQCGPQHHHPPGCPWHLLRAAPAAAADGPAQQDNPAQHSYLHSSSPCRHRN